MLITLSGTAVRPNKYWLFFGKILNRPEDHSVWAHLISTILNWWSKLAGTPCIMFWKFRSSKRIQFLNAFFDTFPCRRLEFAYLQSCQRFSRIFHIRKKFCLQKSKTIRLRIEINAEWILTKLGKKLNKMPNLGCVGFCALKCKC